MKTVDHFHLDRQGQRVTLDLMSQVPSLAVDLEVTVTRQDQIGSGGPRVSTGERVQPLPFNAAASEARTSLHAELVRWVRWVSECRNLILPNKDTASALARWIADNVIELALTEGSEDAPMELGAVIRHARSVIDRPQSEVIRVDPTRLAQAHAEQLNARGIATLAKHIGAQGLTVRRINHLVEKHKITPIRYADKKTPIYTLGDILNAHYTTPQRNRIAG